MTSCEQCHSAQAVVIRSKNKAKVCKECFYSLFENDIHECIISSNMFGIADRSKKEKLHKTVLNKSETICREGDSHPRPSGDANPPLSLERSNPIKVGIGISGGKDSTVLAYVLHLLNIRYNYGLELVLLCVDEGISGYRDQSIDTVHSNRDELGLRLKIVSYEELFGTSMDKVVGKIGKKGNCTYCGVFRRQALEDAARKTSVDYIVTGHNADDMAETVLLNILRGDAGRLARCTSCTGSETRSATDAPQATLSLPRCKPFKYSYQQEIVLYVYFKKLKYFSTECPYSPNASRGDARSLVKELENIDAGIIERIIQAGEDFSGVQNTISHDVRVSKCDRCNHPTSGTTCIACSLLEKLKINN